MRVCTNSHTVSKISRRQIIEGDEAKATVLRYADWLVTTCNAAMPDGLYSLPVPHPCTISMQNVVDMDADYHNLINAVEGCVTSPTSTNSSTSSKGRFAIATTLYQLQFSNNPHNTLWFTLGSHVRIPVGVVNSPRVSARGLTAHAYV